MPGQVANSAPDDQSRGRPRGRQLALEARVVAICMVRSLRCAIAPMLLYGLHCNASGVHLGVLARGCPYALRVVARDAARVFHCLTSEPLPRSRASRDCSRERRCDCGGILRFGRRPFEPRPLGVVLVQHDSSRVGGTCLSCTRGHSAARPKTRCRPRASVSRAVSPRHASSRWRGLPRVAVAHRCRWRQGPRGDP